MNPVASITPEQVYEIARIKHADDMRWHLPLEGVARSVVGTARTMGIVCQESKEVDMEGNERVAQQDEA